LLEGALERPDRVVDLALGHVYVGDEGADAVVAAAGLELGELGQRHEALAGVVEGLAAPQDVVGVLGLELEGGGVGLGGAGVVAGELELTGQGDVSPDAVVVARSEEHTSELQSRENLVCRLLLEKK